MGCSPGVKDDSWEGAQEVVTLGEVSFSFINRVRVAGWLPLSSLGQIHPWRNVLPSAPCSSGLV